MDWDRLEAEFVATGSSPDTAPALAERIVATARRRRAWRASLIALGAGLVGAALIGGLLVVVRHRPAVDLQRRSDRAAPVQPDRRTRAQIYAAALTGGPRPHRLVRPVWVNSAVCVSVPTTPSPASCADEIIPASVRRAVVAVLGPRLHFSSHPPIPHRAGAVPVVQFGRLVLRGQGARLGIETRCGPLCGEGETLQLRHHDGHWEVAGSVGPRWVS